MGCSSSSHKAESPKVVSDGKKDGDPQSQEREKQSEKQKESEQDIGLPAPKKAAVPEVDVVSHVLNRAKASQETGLTPTDEIDWDHEDILTHLLGAPATNINTPDTAPRKAKPAPQKKTKKAPSSAPLPTPSAAAMRYAAKMGVALPTHDEAEPYTALDNYVDDLLGIPPDERAAHWERPSDATVLSAMPEAIRKSSGPKPPSMPQEDDPLDDNLQKELVTPYFSNVIGGWASIDAEVLKDTTANSTTAPKRAAEPKQAASKPNPNSIQELMFV